MTKLDYQLEKHYKHVGARPQRKFEETLTHFNRDIFWYNRDSINRQSENTTKVTYETHRKVISTAVHFLKKDTQHEIALCILTHRMFAEYRNSVFAGKGNFNTDYSFLVKKIAMLFNPTTSRLASSTIATKLKEYTEPTLVQLNHVTGTVSTVTPASDKLTLNEWATKYNESANETTTYAVAGMSLAA